ncbi:MAG: FtsX-like permease family protein [Nocardioides sp.]
MLFRRLRAHGSDSLMTLALVVVVTTVGVGVVGAGRVTHTSAAVAFVVVLAGLTALADQVGAEMRAHRRDLALGRLRGQTRAGVTSFAAAPLLMLTFVAAVVGAVLGVGFASRLAHRWDASYSVKLPEIAVALAVLVCCWVTVFAVALGLSRQPLGEALAVRQRRHGASLLVRFTELLIIVAAVVAVYEARQDNGWLAIAAPGLVGLGVGQVLVWLLQSVPPFGRRLGGFLTTRRFGRDALAVGVVRLIVAAGVVAVTTASAMSASHHWRDQAARVSVGGPLSFPVEAGALRAYAAAHDADPGGRWLLPIAAYDEQRPDHRRVFVDSARWQRVVGDFQSSTSLGDAGAAFRQLKGEPTVTLLRGSRLEVDATGVSGRIGLTVRLVDDANIPREIRIRLDHSGTTGVDLRGCRVGCAAVDITAAGPGHAAVTAVRVGSTSLVRGNHMLDPANHQNRIALHGLPREPGFATPGLGKVASIDGVDGQAKGFHQIGEIGAAPLLGAQGLVLDLGRTLLDARSGSIPVTIARVVARADTPAAVLDRLRADGAGTPTSYDAAVTRLSGTREAHGVEFAALQALALVVLALLHALAWARARVPDRRRETASLRIVGVSSRAARTSYAVESSVLAGSAIVAIVAVGLLLDRVLLAPLRLVSGAPEMPPVDLSTQPVLVLSTALVVGVLGGLVLAFVLTRPSAASRPAALRSDDR